MPLLEARGHKAVSLGRDVTGDIVAFREWPRLLDSLDVVVHLAALAHGAGLDEARLSAANVDVAAAIGRAAAEHGAHMVFLSSVKALGEDSTGQSLSESSPLAPADAYGRTKADAERALGAIDRLPLTILRPPLVYGPGVRANFLSLLHAVTRGWPMPLASIDNRRSLVYLGNLCDAIARSIESPQARGRTYCVCDGAPVSTPELCRALGAALGRPARLYRLPVALLELVPPLRKLTRSLEIDDRALRRELGWSPPFSFEDGLRATAQWYRDTGAWWR